MISLLLPPTLAIDLAHLFMHDKNSECVAVGPSSLLKSTLKPGDEPHSFEYVRGSFHRVRQQSASLRNTPRLVASRSVLVVSDATSVFSAFVRKGKKRKEKNRKRRKEKKERKEKRTEKRKEKEKRNNNTQKTGTV